MSFEQTTIGEYATIQGGYAYKSQDFQPNGSWRVLKIKNVRSGYVDYTDTSFVANAIAASTAKWTTQAGDILISMTGSGPSAPDSLVGRVAKVWRGDLPALINQRVGRLCLKDDSAIDKDFLFYLLSLSETQEFLVANSTGSANQVNISAKTIESVPCPKISFQNSKEIASILSALDERIILLRETNTTLEAIAQALFKSWFVDFDPVHAKAQGIAPEGMVEATAAMFPDRFEESELGLVPKGWNIEPLPEVFDFREGPGIRNWQYTNSDQGTRFINIRCIQDSDLSIATANRITDEEANGKYAHFHLRAWDVVVSTSGTLGRSAIVRDEHLPLMLNTSVIRFQPLQKKMRFCFLYEYLNSPEFLYKLESMASGSVQKNFGPMHIKQIKLVCPSVDLLEHYESLCRPLFEALVANRARIATLATLRDTLLPRLISGQLRLPDAEAVLEEVAA